MGMLKAFLPGSFDPPTFGHIKLIERASKLCDELYVGIGENLEKKGRLLSSDEIKRLLELETKHLKNVKIVTFSGLTVEYAKKIGATAIIRGLRDTNDLIRETQMAKANYTLSGLETLFLIAAAEEASISSTLIRELAIHGADLNAFMPSTSADQVKEQIRRVHGTRHS